MSGAMQSMAYMRVSNSDNRRRERSEDDQAEDAARYQALVAKRKRAEQRHLVRLKFEALFWMAIAGAISYYGDGKSNILDIVLHSPRIHRDYLWASVSIFTVNTGIFIYLSFWLKYIVKSHNEWNQDAPWAIPTATLLGILQTILFFVALWPVYKYFTPFVQFALFMGFMMSFHLLPSFGLKKQSVEVPAEKDIAS